MLLVAGRRPDNAVPNDIDMDAVAVQIQESSSLVVRRCETPGQLPSIVEAVAQQLGPIDVLDLYDHGSPGRQLLGNQDWVGSDEDRNQDLFGRSTVLGLRDHLRDTAHIRLLGCGTAGGVSSSRAGRLLLVKMARLLGGRRIVFGTIRAIRASDFGPTGFRRVLETDYLFSSLAAIDGAPPTTSEREQHLLEVRRDPV